MNISDGICAYLQGGLGNQLFILATSWAQAKRLDVPLYIDASRYVARDPLDIGYETQRQFELGELELPGVVITEESPWFRNSPRRPAIARRTSSSRRLAVYRESGKTVVDGLQEVAPGTTLFGYFQSPAYFDVVQGELAALLHQYSTSLWQGASGGTESHEPFITVHLRRGDYLLESVGKHHGVASAAYVERALSIARRLSGIDKAMVFSDDIDIARTELQHLPDLTFVEEDGRRSSLATLVTMARAEAFVMSNSSFSWWAAWLMNRDSAKTVIAPRPWSPSGVSDHKVLSPDWLSAGID